MAQGGNSSEAAFYLPVRCLCSAPKFLLAGTKDRACPCDIAPNAKGPQPVGSNREQKELCEDVPGDHNPYGNASLGETLAVVLARGQAWIFTSDSHRISKGRPFFKNVLTVNQSVYAPSKDWFTDEVILWDLTDLAVPQY